MIDSLSQIIGLTQQSLVLGFLVFLRIGSAMAVLPAFGERSVPVRVRLALAGAFVIIVAPAIGPKIEVPSGLAVLWGLSEILNGLLIGMALRFFVIALQIAGSIAAQSTSLSQIFGAAGIDPQPTIGHLLVIGGLAIAVSTGFHVRVAELFIYSYQIMEPGKIVPSDMMSSWGVGQITYLFGLGFSLAAPFVIASLIYNVALGVINRAMPQLMVAFVGAPAITAGGLLLLFGTMPILLSVWQSALNSFFEYPFEIR